MIVMEWHDLVTYNEHGECAAADVEAIVKRFESFVESRGCQMGIDGRRMAHQILRYIQLRCSVSGHQITNPQSTIAMPPGWTKENERDWNAWIHHVFQLEEWQKEIMDPVFGTNERMWEVTCSGWRDELFCFLPWWVKRSVVPELLPEEGDDEESDDGKKIDPYLLEHGSAKQRRAMMKG